MSKNINIKLTRAMKRDLKLMTKRGKDLTKLEIIVALLIKQKTLEARHKDHVLSGTWRGYRECHIEPDWLLIYKVIDATLHLVRTGPNVYVGVIFGQDKFRI